MCAVFCRRSADFFLGGNMPFADIHIHAVCGVDDGAITREGMFRMVDAAYSDGTRLMCVTPHFHPGAFGEHHKKTLEEFKCLKEYAAEKYPDLELYLGNEMRYSDRCQDWLYDGVCLSMGGTKYVLTEFSFGETSERITKALESMFNFGYIPIVAHAERYHNLPLSQIRKLHSEGVLIQVDSMSLLKKFGFKEWYRSKKMLALGTTQGADRPSLANATNTLKESLEKAVLMRSSMKTLKIYFLKKRKVRFDFLWMNRQI